MGIWGIWRGGIPFLFLSFISLSAFAAPTRITCLGALAGVTVTLPDADPKAQYAIVVDPVSAGNAIAPSLAAREVVPIYVLSSSLLPNYLLHTFQPQHFAGGLDFVDNRFSLEEKVNLIRTSLQARGHKIVAVYAGSESGVTLSKRLERSYGFIETPLEKIDALRDKERLGRFLIENGFDAPTQQAVSSVEEGIAFARGNLSFPVIVKPVDGAASHNVILAPTESHLRDALTRVLTTPNIFGEVPERALVQETIPKYLHIVGLVVSRGVVKKVCFWKYHMEWVPGGSFLFNRVELLPESGELQDQLYDYVKRFAVDTLEGKDGAFHAEVFVTPQPSGPPRLRLIDLAGRMAGGRNREVTLQATGVDIADYLVVSRLDPEAFARLPDYRRKNAASIVGINTLLDGFVMGNHDEIVRRLKSQCPSIRHVVFNFKAGEKLPISTDLTKMTARVELIHSDPEQVERDIERLTELFRGERIFYEKK